MHRAEDYQTSNMASSVWNSLTCNNLFVAFAAVTGFVEKKEGPNVDYVFVVEVYWSDGRTTYVKRTYSDFETLQRDLESFVKTEKHTFEGSNPIPRLEGRKLFRKNDRKLAEYRELELHKFVKEILLMHPQMSSSPIVVEFFEARSSDPIPPVREPMETTDFYEMDEFDAYT